MVANKKGSLRAKKTRKTRDNKTVKKSSVYSERKDWRLSETYSALIPSRNNASILSEAEVEATRTLVREVETRTKRNRRKCSSARRLAAKASLATTSTTVSNWR